MFFNFCILIGGFLKQALSCSTHNSKYNADIVDLPRKNGIAANKIGPFVLNINFATKSKHFSVGFFFGCCLTT